MADLSEVFGVSRERVRQIEVKAKEKVRDALIESAEAKGMSVKEFLPF